jgi:NADPH2:quinone reductase
MRSIQVTRFGGPEVLQPVSARDPEPAAGELLIDVDFAEVLFLDTQLRAGWGRDYFDVEPPFIPGVGIVGTVVAGGEEASDRVGRRVVASTSSAGEYRGGGYAERALGLADGALEVPSGLAGEHAIAALHDGVMAVGRAEKAGLVRGDVALVTAAGGAIGNWLLPMLRDKGVTVFAAARGERKLSLATERGADVVLDYGEDNWAEGVDREVDAVFDGAGGRIGADALRSLRRGGRFFSYGAASGEFPDVEASAAERDVEIVGINDSLGAEEMREAAEKALRLLADGLMEPVIGQIVPLGRAADAHAAIASRTVAGKTLLAP